MIQQSIKTTQPNLDRVVKEKHFVDVYYNTKKALRPFTVAQYNDMTR